MTDTIRSDALMRERDQRREQFDQMLRDAGIGESQIERAWEGSFIPYGALGDEDSTLDRTQNNKMYWADEHDSRRRKIRKLVFGIAEKEKRLDLIETCMEWERKHREMLEESLREYERELIEVRSQSKLGGWYGAAFNAAIFVALGYWVFKLPGAMAGALVGFFLGQREVARFQVQAEGRVREVEGLAQDQKDSIREERNTPMFFNDSERHSGDEDREFDLESAVANLYQEFANEKSRSVA